MERKKLLKPGKYFSDKAKKRQREVNEIRRETGIHNPTYRSLLEETDIDPNSIPDHNSKTKEPLFISKPGLKVTIVELLRDGHHTSTVCNYAGIDYTTFTGWLRKGKEGKDKAYYDFYNEVRMAEAEAEVNRLKNIKDHSKIDWKASAWIMERKWPERWAKRDHSRHDVTVHNETTITVRDEFAKNVIEDVDFREVARDSVGRTARLLPSGGTSKST